MSHPAPPAAEGGFQRGMEVLLVGQWCCGLNYWGLGVWGRMRCGGLDWSHAGRAPTSSLGLAMGLGMVAWPVSPSFPAPGSSLPFAAGTSCHCLNGHIEEQGTTDTREHGPDKGQGNTEMSGVPACSHSSALHVLLVACLCWKQGRFSLHFPLPRTQQPPPAQHWLSQGWIHSAAGQSVGGGCRSRLGNTKQ